MSRPKGDISKFFANIDHDILKMILKKYIKDEDILWLLSQIIDSFEMGLPLGNLTSQLLINIYMNEFDQFVKRDLKVKYYLRYADDFVIFHQDKEYLIRIIPRISEYLQIYLKLTLNPNKLQIKTLFSGVDFLGWVHFLNHRVLRTSTKRRMLRRLDGHFTEVTLNSYLGLLKHGHTHRMIS